MSIKDVLKEQVQKDSPEEMAAAYDAPFSTTALLDKYVKKTDEKTEGAGA